MENYESIFNIICDAGIKYHHSTIITLKKLKKNYMIPIICNLVKKELAVVQWASVTSSLKKIANIFNKKNVIKAFKTYGYSYCNYNYCSI